MAFDETLLAIKRAFSKDEKYKLFLQYVNNLEDEIAREIKRSKELLLKTKTQTLRVQELEHENAKLKNELNEYSTTDMKKYIKRTKHEKMLFTKAMWEKRFWEVNAELNKLKNETAAAATGKDA